MVFAKEHPNEIVETFTSPNTTFEKEVIKKIGNREVPSVTVVSPSEKKGVSLHDPKEINSILEPMSELKLKRIHNLPDSSKITPDYSIAISIEQEITFYITLDDKGKYLEIFNFSKNTHTVYQLQSVVNEEVLEKYVNTTK
ncbi:hypothetical protein [Gorillibacterium massiliense]|uniref:hypothetical protein n=1 Tax=Gorillibacterium massiliense TaxID=1280390 RepID=UPI0012DFC57C|nr:hypothetical protein [Gorillibacterium massiliense]